MLFLKLSYFFFLNFIASKLYWTYFDGLEKTYSNLKHNIGFLHEKNFENPTFILLNRTSCEKSLYEHISLWKAVNLIDVNDLFIGLNNLDFNQNSKHLHIAVCEYFYNNYFEQNILFFNNNFDLKLYFNQTINLKRQENFSFSNFHLKFEDDGILTYGLPLLKKHKDIDLNRIESEFLAKWQNNEIYISYNATNEFKNSCKCSIKYKEELLFSSIYEIFSNNLKKKSVPGKKQVAMLIPTLSLFENVYDIPLMKSSVSIAESLTKHELDNFSFTFYLAFDRNDIVLHKEENRNLIKNYIKSHFNGNQVNIIFKEYPVSKSVVFLWNSLFIQAYSDNNDLFVQLNDDTKILNKGWLAEADRIFEKNNNNGVVGFNAVEWNCTIFTQAIVTRNHYKKFSGLFYPNDFINAMSDLWLTKIYKNESFCLKNFQTMNHLSKTRYDKCPYNKALIQKILNKTV